MEIQLNEGKLRHLFRELSDARNTSGTENAFKSLGKALACADSVLTTVSGVTDRSDPRQTQQFKDFIRDGVQRLEAHLKEALKPEVVEQRLQALKEQPKEHWLEAHKRAKEAVMNDPDEVRRKQTLQELDSAIKATMDAYDDGTLFRQVLYMQMYEEIVRAFYRPLADQAIAAFFMM